MKSGVILFLVGLVILLSFGILALRKELLNSRKHAALLEGRNNKLHMELMRLNRIHSASEQFLNELEQSVRELENKMPFATLERYIPRKLWDEIRPIIDRLKFLQETRENRASSDEEGDHRQ